ncbi:hypothetical protein MCP_2822 [Methanocella paludicola SANAE]|uniref:Glycosyltransferase RgtA/B/C/D-like domain-containing protein n=1 Tax=Methanocella paludicola (strain DSM 17711 / JCM 13418 / NBRC 101707 / SANAE) TaxID=304371 RepID=D1Z2H2_METPS|nr:glycosyltransferase family 39 protein [Methanocella paludicola]BAI62894.1 hypothetical protein MCP_2822 [Methanocella paludicola SANAE]
MSKATVYALAAGTYGALFLAFAFLEDILISGAWRPFDIASYYGLASSAVPAIYAILGEGASSPVLLFHTGVLSGYRIFIVSVLCLAGALLVMEIGRRSYGSASGFMAGLLFALSMAMAQGHLNIGDALSVLLALISAYAMFCTEWGHKYALSGLLIGLAACYKPLMLVLLPVALAVRYRRGEARHAFALVAAALPLIAAMALALALYGYCAPAVAAGGGFEAIGFLTDEGYRPPDLLMAVAGIALSACMLTSLLPLALLGFSRHRGPFETYCLAVGLCFISALVLKQYLQYWFIALPFLALLCASAFKGPENAPARVNSAEKQALNNLAPVIKHR